MQNYNSKFKILILLIVGVLVVGGWWVFGKKSTGEQGVSEVVKEQGLVIATSNYKDYSAFEYETAKKDGKVILLYFTANWCPICREQEPVNQEVLKELEGSPEVVAFRIHILDSETTEETEKLAEEFGVTYQHTFIVLDKNGNVSSKYTGPLAKQDLKDRILVAK